MSKKILLISCGGTITMNKSDCGIFRPFEESDDLEIILPILSEVAEIEVLPVFNIDSSNISFDHFRIVAESIRQKINSCDGIVVIHGTDTMVYTAAFVSFMCQDLPIPVVFTGSQLPLSVPGSDGMFNLINSVRVATMDLAEVVICFGSKIIRGTRAIKQSSSVLDAYISANQDPLGEVGIMIKLNNHRKLRRHQVLKYSSNLSEKISLMKLYPGFNSALIDYLVEMDYQGIILEGYGMGNVPAADHQFMRSIQAAVEKGILVVITSGCIQGGSNPHLYETGRLAEQLGVIHVGEMTPTCTFAKLSYLMGILTPTEASRLLSQSLIGEMGQND